MLGHKHVLPGIGLDRGFTPHSTNCES
jgi:hypothetical protein